MSSTHDVTRLLGEWAKGNQHALQELTPLVYRELRQLAAGYLRKERLGHTLQSTALVHEATGCVFRDRKAGLEDGQSVASQRNAKWMGAP
jgi:hypothetical protein